jgi:tetratricopeptide (TPR) repeat protein/predicted ATPase
MSELRLHFLDPGSIRVSVDGETTEPRPFSNPLTRKDLEDLRWYLEVYPTSMLGEPDVREASRIAAQLATWGRSLFDAAFQSSEARRLFDRFLAADSAHILTIRADQPSIQALPWELLHSTGTEGTFLIGGRPTISIRRWAQQRTSSFRVAPRETIHILFVTSRPVDQGFVDPRADPAAMLDVLERQDHGRFTWEFLHPATIAALAARLDDSRCPRVDILHFDGHGAFGDAGGVLLFETIQADGDVVSAERLGEHLRRHCVPLVVLSACQSAFTDDGDAAIGSIASELVAVGVPAVVAMTHSVLADTTEILFGPFYDTLARGRTVSQAVDAGRLRLQRDPKRHEVTRYGPDDHMARSRLELYDWCVPVLYQSDDDWTLIREKAGSTSEVRHGQRIRTNVAHSADGFFGRARELWTIERALSGASRRLVITGFSGQGKTALAMEAARWLTRTGMFQAAVVVDYGGVPWTDSVAFARRVITEVLERDTVDTADVARMLSQTAVLVVLDNLHGLDESSLAELLTAARSWSEVGKSRVIVVTRRSPIASDGDDDAPACQRLVLAGMGSAVSPESALALYEKLASQPPAATVPALPRDVLAAFLAVVDFHPLSIRSLAAHLKHRRLDDLGARLERLLDAPSANGTANPTIAATRSALRVSLQESLDQLAPETRRLLRRLGVFHDGAFEHDILAVTRLGNPYTDDRDRLQDFMERLQRRDPRAVLQLDSLDVPETGPLSPELLANVSYVSDEEVQQAVETVREWLAFEPDELARDVWPSLRRWLENASLIQVGRHAHVRYPYLRFHPALAMLLWSELTADERTTFGERHRKQYYELAKHLHQQDTRTPGYARAVVRPNLRNLLTAVHDAFTTGDPNALDFADKMSGFLIELGLLKDFDAIVSRANQTSSHGRSPAWHRFQMKQAERLRTSGRLQEASAIIEDLLAHPDTSSPVSQAVCLAGMGRCLMAGGRLEQAEQRYREAAALLRHQSPSYEAAVISAQVSVDLATVLMHAGRYPEAQDEFEEAFHLARNVGDVSGQSVAIGQLGTLAWFREAYDEAEELYQQALGLSDRLRAPLLSAQWRHQLGLVYERTQRWDDAELAYRESARVQAEYGELNGAAEAWSQLAVVSLVLGRREAAEHWFQKVISTFDALGHPRSAAQARNNLAAVLMEQPARLDDARQLATHAATFVETLESTERANWTTYDLLAAIAVRQADAAGSHHRSSELLAEAEKYYLLARRDRPST